MLKPNPISALELPSSVWPSDVSTKLVNEVLGITAVVAARARVGATANANDAATMPKAATRIPARLRTGRRVETTRTDERMRCPSRSLVGQGRPTRGIHRGSRSHRAYRGRVTVTPQGLRTPCGFLAPIDL